MPKTSHIPPISREPNGLNRFDALDHRREWERHVDAGRIGKRLPTGPEIVTRRTHNELVLLGEYRLPVW